MRTHSLRFADVGVDAPLAWREITDEVDAPEPPFTLADCSKDSGALQFSLACYVSGRVPDPSPTLLLSMAEDMGVSHGLTDPHDRVTEAGPPRLGAISYRYAESFVRVWYVSDGRNFAKVTYICDWGTQSEQLEECEAIVRSLRFL